MLVRINPRVTNGAFRHPAGPVLVLFLSLCFGSVACRIRPVAVVPDVGANSALYKARIERDGERDRRFRMLLFAAEPDRLHVEVLSPVGTTVMILDGGAGQVSVAIPRERRAYVGAADPALFERLLGVPVGLSDWIAALRHGRQPSSTIEIERVGLPGSLPTNFAASRATTRLQLDLRRLQPLGAGAADLGIGRPPDGFEIRPIDEFLQSALPEEMEPIPANH